MVLQKSDQRWIGHFFSDRDQVGRWGSTCLRLVCLCPDVVVGHVAFLGLGWKWHSTAWYGCLIHELCMGMVPKKCCQVSKEGRLFIFVFLVGDPTRLVAAFLVLCCRWFPLPMKGRWMNRVGLSKGALIWTIVHQEGIVGIPQRKAPPNFV